MQDTTLGAKPLPAARDITPMLDGTGPILVFGGPYSNLAATAAMRARAEDLAIPPERTICTGDVIAYCAEPEETSQFVRDWGCHVVAGNCEEQIAAGAADCGCGFEEGSACDILAKGWYPYANQRTSHATRAWMAQLPASITFGTCGLRFRVVHGGSHIVNAFVFASQRDLVASEHAAARADVVIAGHAGLPFMRRVAGGAWFNPGVIGMPANDGTTDVWYGLIIALPGGGVRLSAHRLAYDCQAAAAAVRRQGYADDYARALITGLWPSLDILPPLERARTGQRQRVRSVDIALTRRAFDETVSTTR
jgi:predicted phosphodiesterase